MSSRWIDITLDNNETFSGYLSLPPTGKGPGLILIQEIWGVNDHIRAVADGYAQAGYVVLAPDVFWRLEPRVDLQYDQEGSAKARDLYGKLDTTLATQDLVAAAKHLKTLPEVMGKVGTIGYCLGGQLSYRIAAAGAVDAAVSFYGGGIHAHLDVADNVTMPVLFHYANNDSHIPQEAVAQVKQAFAGKANATFFDYPETEHGFNCWGRPAMYNQRAAALAQGRTLEFLATQL